MKHIVTIFLAILILPFIVQAGSKGLLNKHPAMPEKPHADMRDMMGKNVTDPRVESLYFENSPVIYKTISPLAGIISVPEEYASIQAAIDAALNGDTVLVADSTYYENINFKGKVITVASYFLMDGDTNHINNTIINGSQPADPKKGSVISFISGEDTMSVLCGFTITGGTGTLYNNTERIGGGIYCQTSGARITHNKIISNTINHTDECNGGGIGCWPLSNAAARYVIIENNVIESNTISSSNAASFISGGGIFILKGRVTGNKIRYNSVLGQPIFSGGGGIEANCEDTASRTLVVISDNIISHNQTNTDGTYGGYGGGVDVVFCNVQIMDNEITYNEAGGSYGNGGGVRLWRSKNISILKNNIISFNSSSGFKALGGVGGGLLYHETSGVTIQDNSFNENKSHYGGAIFEQSSSGGTISGNEFVNNLSDSSAGAIYLQESTLTITANLFRGNQARYSGAIFNYSGDYQITNNTFVQNKTSGWGGAINSRNNQAGNITRNEFANNSADSSGGACYLHGSNLTLTNNLFQANSAKYGGAVLDYLGDYKFTNNIFTKNEAHWGGGIFSFDEPAQNHLTEIINNTFTGNAADTAGAVACKNTKVVLMNTICWGNSAPHGPEIEMWGGTLNIAYSDVRFGPDKIVIDSVATINWLEGNIVTDPYFADMDYRLSENSFCLGAGTMNMNIDGKIYSAPDTDFEGNTRPSPAESSPDMGAYESPFESPGGVRLVPEAYANIQDAIDAAVDGEVVLVQDSTYYENIDFKGKAITVASYFYVYGDTNHINNTIINGSQPSHVDSGSVVYFISGEDTTSVLCGFTITEGSGTETTYLWEDTQWPCRAGGGIFCYNSGAIILNNKIIDNTVNAPDKEGNGGGVVTYPLGGTSYVILKDNQILHNTVTANSDVAWGGGLSLYCNGIMVNNLISHNSVILNTSNYQAGSGGVDCFSFSSDRRKVIFESNKITYNSVVSSSNSLDVPSAIAGGIMIQGSFGQFTKNEVSYNELWVNSDKNASGAGMEILDVPESFIIDGNILRENAVKQGTGWGGGMNIFQNSYPTLVNNLIDGNSATNGGGILIGEDSEVKLINNTIINNLATSGGGIFIGLTSSTNYLMNTIIWGNQATTNAAIHIHAGTIHVAYCNVQGSWTGTGNINLDPELIADSLSNNSPCIGKGTLEYDFGGGMVCNAPSTDINGRSRPYPAGTNPDIGAWESLLENKNSIRHDPLKEIPLNFTLEQNYPNPFNPRTVISWQLAVSSDVDLSIYNVLGQKIINLISQKQPAGFHSVEWDASGFASGVYLYKLSTDKGFTQTKKLVLLK